MKFFKILTHKKFQMCWIMVGGLIANAHTYSGRVVDDRYSTPISNVNVILSSSGDSTQTDSNGYFTIDAGPLKIKDDVFESKNVWWDGYSLKLRWRDLGQPYKIALYSLQNKIITTSMMTEEAGAWSLPSLKNGFYFLILKSNGSVSQIKFLVMENRVSNHSISIKKMKVHDMASPKISLANDTLSFEKSGWDSKVIMVNQDEGDMNVEINRVPIKVLVLDGYNNHSWSEGTRVVKSILENTSMIAVDVATVPAVGANDALFNNWDPGFDNYEVIYMNLTNLFQTYDLPLAIKNSFENFVNNGGGVYNLHAASSSYPDWEGYQKISGYGWRDEGVSIRIENGQAVELPSGVGAVGHGARFDAVVNKLVDHPINRGIPDQWKANNTEVYTHPKAVSGNLSNMIVLSYARDLTNGTNQDWPMEALIKYGEGYGYTSVMGHLAVGERAPQRMFDVGFLTMKIRAIEWMARQEIVYPVPINFPTVSNSTIDTVLWESLQ